MPERKGQPRSAVDAVQRIYEALEPLEAETRERVIVSVKSLLGMPVEETRIVPARVAPVGQTQGQARRPLTTPTSAPSLSELLRDKQPASTTQRIAVFAYYREKVEDLTRFSRADLKEYFPRAKLPPPKNFDRDFVKTVRLGWIHEDGADSYLTTKGLEAAEAGFAGKQLPRRGEKALRTKGRRRRKKTRLAKARRKTAKRR